MKRIFIRVRGRVQGVCFRAFTQAEAHKLQVSGWVMNEADGSVSGEAQADDEALAEFIRRLELGPGLSRVDSVYTSELLLKNDEVSFKINY